VESKYARPKALSLSASSGAVPRAPPGDRVRAGLTPAAPVPPSLPGPCVGREGGRPSGLDSPSGAAS